MNEEEDSVCERCASGDTVKRRMLNTLYKDDSANYSESCWNCFVELWSYYCELWSNVEGGSPFSGEPPENMR